MAAMKLQEKIQVRVNSLQQYIRCQSTMESFKRSGLPGSIQFMLQYFLSKNLYQVYLVSTWICFFAKGSSTCQDNAYYANLTQTSLTVCDNCYVLDISFQMFPVVGRCSHRIEAASQVRPDYKATFFSHSVLRSVLHD